MMARWNYAKEVVREWADHAKIAFDWSNDGCSGVPDLNFRACCNQHDFAYRNAVISRREADTALRLCIADQGWVVVPWIYWIGVRLFGWRFYRWDRRVAWLERHGEVPKKVAAALIDARMADAMAREQHVLRGVARWVMKRVIHAVGIRVRV